MSTRTLLIVSYYFAPSPPVGAKRFSFLAREFERQGYDVHVITNESRESTARARRHFAAARRHGASLRRAVRSAARGPQAGWLAPRTPLLRRLLAPVGMRIFLGTRRHAQGARESRATYRGGMVIATSPPHAALIAGARIARRLGWPLIARLSRSVERDTTGRAGVAAPLAQWFARRIERRSWCGSARARAEHARRCATWFEKFFPRAPRGAEFRDPQWFRSGRQRLRRPSDGPMRHRARRRDLHGGRSLVPVLRAVARLRTAHPQRPIRLTTYGELPAAELAAHPRRRARAVHRGAAAHSVRRAVRRIAARARAAGGGRRAHALFDALQGVRLHGGRPAHPRLAPRGAALFELLADSGAGVCVEAERHRRHRAGARASCCSRPRRRRAHARRPLPLVEPGAAVPGRHRDRRPARRRHCRSVAPPNHVARLDA